MNYGHTIQVIQKPDIFRPQGLDYGQHPLHELGPPPDMADEVVLASQCIQSERPFHAVFRRLDPFDGREQPQYRIQRRHTGTKAHSIRVRAATSLLQAPLTFASNRGTLGLQVCSVKSTAAERPPIGEQIFDQPHPVNCIGWPSKIDRLDALALLPPSAHVRILQRDRANGRLDRLITTGQSSVELNPQLNAFRALRAWGQSVKSHEGVMYSAAMQDPGSSRPPTQKNTTIAGLDDYGYM